MKKILIILFCLGLAGCASFSKSILEKDGEIIKLQDLLKEKEQVIEKKDLKIKQLRKKLENFGIIDRKPITEKPLEVHYILTAKGKKVSRIINQMKKLNFTK